MRLVVRLAEGVLLGMVWNKGSVVANWRLSSFEERWHRYLLEFLGAPTS